MMNKACRVSGAKVCFMDFQLKKMKTIYMKNAEGFERSIQLDGTIVTIFKDRKPDEFIDYPTESMACEAANKMYEKWINAGFGECSKPYVKKIPCAKRRKLDENGSFVRC